MHPITRPSGGGGAIYVGPREDPHRYQVGDTVGTGGEGEVAHGVLLVEGIPVDVAIKMWRHRGEGHITLEEQAQAWRNQLRLVQSISHPGIVRMREAFVGAPPHHHGEADRPGEVLYLVMNWAPGVNLTQWVADHPGATYEDVCTIVAAVAEALAHLHSGVDTGGQPILHRDLKPANVILAGRDRVQIVDFGLASGARRAPDGSGTPAYLAPEVARFGRFSPASDIFGLGALTYYLFVRDSPPQLLSDQHDLSSLRQALLAAPLLAGRPELAEHILAAMAPDAAARPTDAVAWAAGLRRTRRDVTSVAGSPDQTIVRRRLSLPPPPPGPQRRAAAGRTGPALAATATLLVVIATLAVLAFQRMASGSGEQVATGSTAPGPVGPADPVTTTGSPPTVAPTTTTVAPTTTTVPTTRPPATVTEPPTTAGSPAPAATTFVMPSRNIGCSISAAGARCDINVKYWTAPPPTTSCALTWGDAVQVGPGGAGFACHRDTLLGASDVLGYGRTARAGTYRCDSAETGVTCRNESTGHGFTLAREAYDLF